MTLALVRCSIKAEQGGTVSGRARVYIILVSWEGGSHAVLFGQYMWLLGVVTGWGII